MAKLDTIFGKDKRGFFGRRLGRPLSAARQNLMDNLLPRLRIAADDLTEDGSLSPTALFPVQSQQTILEIGFGNGERLAQMMARETEHNYIGAEPFQNGMSTFLDNIKDRENANIRLWDDDAFRLVRSLADQSIDVVYILNPDPWHKTKHHKRRVVNPTNLNELARIIKPAGNLILTTDVPYLAEWMIAHTVNHGGFEWAAKSKKDWETPPPNWIQTKYEKKGAKGAHKMHYFLFERKA